MTSIDDIEGFNLSIGGHINDEWMNFGGSEANIKKLKIGKYYPPTEMILLLVQQP